MDKQIASNIAAAQRALVEEREAPSRAPLNQPLRDGSNTSASLALGIRHPWSGTSLRCCVGADSCAPAARTGGTTGAIDPSPKLPIVMLLSGKDFDLASSAQQALSLADFGAHHLSAVHGW